jgi:hypothetical protein
MKSRVNSPCCHFVRGSKGSQPGPGGLRHPLQAPGHCPARPEYPGPTRVAGSPAGHCVTRLTHPASPTERQDGQSPASSQVTALPAAEAGGSTIPSLEGGDSKR